MNIQPIVSFLRDLARHNDREWFQGQADRYADARLIFKEFVGELIEALAKDEPAWAELDPAKCIFRLHRDLRFSKNKTPYKTNFSASLSAGGKSVDAPGVYVSIEPGGKSMVAGGLYQPTPAELQLIRTRIAADPAEYRALLKARAFQKYFPEGLNGDRSKVVRGYRPDHKAYDLIQIKSHIAFRTLPDEDVLAKTFAGTVAGSCRALIPLCRWLGEARVDPTASGRPGVVLSEQERRTWGRKNAR